MTVDVQSILVGAIVIATAALLLRGAIRKRKKPGCGGDCGCPTDELKAKLKR